MKKIIKRVESSAIANLKVEWHKNMIIIDRLYYEIEYLEKNGIESGHHALRTTISKFAQRNIALDYRIQRYHEEKNEYVYNQLHASRSFYFQKD